MKGHKAFIGTLVSKITPYCEASIEDVNVSKLKTELSYINARLEVMDNLFSVVLEHPDITEAIITNYTEYILGVRATVQQVQDKVDSITPSPERADTSLQLDSTHLNSSITSISKGILAHANLPKLELQPFYGGDGCWREYRSFIEMFNALVGSDEELSNTLKVQYLKGALKGEAEKLVKHLDPVAANYELILEQLEIAYKVGHEEINHLVGKLMEITAWPKCTSGKDLFRLLTHIKQYYYLLNQARPDRTEDIFIVRAIIGLLPDRLGYKLLDHVPVEGRTVETVLEWMQRDINSQKEGKSYGLGKASSSGSNKFQQSGKKAMAVQKSSRPCL